MGTISGMKGAVDGAHSVRNWSITSTAALQAAVASNTKGGTVTLPGNTDWSGNFGAYGHTPAVLPGEIFTFSGSIDGTKGAAGSAIVDQVVITIDIEAGAIISHTVNFSSVGALTLGNVAVADATTPNPPSSIGCKVELATPAGSPSWVELDDVRVITITLTRSNVAYVSSGTAGANSRVLGNLSATVAITLYTDDFGALPAKNDVRGARLYVNATEFWLINWLRIGDVTDLTVDIEGPNVVPASITGQWTGYTNISDTPTEGTITTPAGDEVWPEYA